MGKAKIGSKPRFVGSKGILALIDEEHPVPKGGWTASVIAAACGLSVATVLHHLERLRGWSQVTSSVTAKAVPFQRKNDEEGAPPRSIEVRTLVWSITSKGERRLELRGGHEAHCPACRKPARSAKPTSGRAAANPEE